MHHHPKFTDLVHVLAVDFDIVDGSWAEEDGGSQDDGFAGVAA